MLLLILFAAFGLKLSIDDIQERRLPNKLTFALFVTLLVFGFITSPSQAQSGLFLSLVYFGVFLALQILSRGSLGMGDVKYSFSCGFVVGYIAKSQWLITLWLIFAVAAIVGLAAIAINKATIKTALPLAPTMTLVTMVIALNSLGTDLS